MYVPVEHALGRGELGRPRATETLPFPLSAPRPLYFYRARNAIYHLFRAAGLGDGQTALVPAYHNTNEVMAIRAAGAKVCFYRIGRDLQPDLEHIAQLARSAAPRTLFVIHYFGWPQPMAELSALCQEHGMVLVEDCALALLSQMPDGRPLGASGQYATYCLYKSLPVPDGGLLVQNAGELEALTRLDLRPCGTVTLGGRTLELALEAVRGRSYALGQAAFALKRAAGRALRALGVRRVPFGDIGFDLDSVNVAISPLSRRLLERFDYDRIRQRRRENYQHLHERLDGAATPLCGELPPGVCPMLFPIMAADKPAAVRSLQARGIAAMEFWNDGDPEASGPESADAHFIRKHVVELPIHQDITPEQVDYMAAEVARLGLRR
jgi:dTDP-4-amino-4,6-dideoxygalactose transaminase